MRPLGYPAGSRGPPPPTNEPRPALRRLPVRPENLRGIAIGSLRVMDSGSGKEKDSKCALRISPLEILSGNGDHAALYHL